MYNHVIPCDLQSTPVHGHYPTDAAPVAVALTLELTPEEAASVVSNFSLLVSQAQRSTVAAEDAPDILRHLLTDLVLHAVREAAADLLQAEDFQPVTDWYDWARQLVNPQTARRARFEGHQLTGAVAMTTPSGFTIYAGH
jgi:hypothetical protein